MIPKNIQREHIIKAIEEIRKKGIAKGRDSRKFLIEFEGYYYPPKYVISLANKYANGKELKPSEFNGGTESNNFLRSLGFDIVEVLPKKASVARRRESVSRTLKHDERCPECKETIRKILEKIYGKVAQNYKFEVGTCPEDFLRVHCYGTLKEIYESLQRHRGFKEFVKATMLPHCDFFIPNPGFILEFDESQHFTLPRRITLEKYPDELELGFSREKWIKLCEEINAKNNDPPYRDEQRAWYDTLRDFLPAVKGLKPTIRLFAKDFLWCSLDPNDASDVATFKKFLRNTSGSWEIEVREEPNPIFSRITIAGEWVGDTNEARRLLEAVCTKWP